MDQKYNRRIYKALVAIVLVVLGGYLINVVFGKFIVYRLYETSIEKWYGTQIFCAYPAAIAAASHAPILYSFSTDYRDAFRKEINILVPKLGRRLMRVETFSLRSTVQTVAVMEQP
ncbi:hypothetical protein DdX_18231 [Ditylenchus destructor]|uniref:Uncharacterized protein n=1 Tax=Ditylenchus destructor TaxID=166010 RepID=A0AAD4MQE8_9BILA|nr:hypothetical protein DdX_18231 [Ditylenchus destructor]